MYPVLSPVTITQGQSLTGVFKKSDYINQSMFPMHPFSNPWKYQKTLQFSDVFRGYRKGVLGANGLNPSCGPNKSWARHHRSSKFWLEFEYFNIINFTMNGHCFSSLVISYQNSAWIQHYQTGDGISTIAFYNHTYSNDSISVALYLGNSNQLFSH